jgi:hypothetical protein
MIFLIFILSLICSIFYRAGGLDKTTPHWIPVWIRQSWVRDWLCPACCLIPSVIIHPSWWILLAYAALGGALSTYWDFLFKKDNFWFSGFMCGVAAFPLLFIPFLWWPLVLRSVVIALLWGSWCKIFSNDHVEEYGRGFLLSITSLFFLI